MTYVFWHITAHFPVATTAQAFCSWFYPGQAAINAMTSVCLTLGASGETASGASAIAEKAANMLKLRL